ncbi:hypothetical protein Aple_029980 [Acrocarpospora pleiomorpha]|uniref:Uncharacterized protein n=1 Tax=Acrocarpospora pleiomorpha TaxID=90975 RepID=A0A5M3XH25_9ACTN|nr:hypothetical protein [Acrocarpospora pleiomorpha]GES20102.1 hypothetical protein Aple_029980 [Acrocarpospora pleiomorpha]
MDAHRSTGDLIAILFLAAGGTALISFLTFPLAGAPFAGVSTGIDVLGRGPTGLASLIWSIPLTASITVALGAWLRLALNATSTAVRTASAFVLFFTVPSLLLWSLPIVLSLPDHVDLISKFLETGYWLVLTALTFAAITALVGICRPYAPVAMTD